MSVFTVSLGSVLQMILYMLPGFLLVKLKKLRLDSMPGFSAVLVYVFTPCLILSSFLKLDFSPALFRKIWIVFFVSLALQLAFVFLLLGLYRKHGQESAYRVMCIGSVLPNAGFFGLPLLTAILPNSPEVAAYACVFCVTMDAVMFTVGVYCLTNDRKSVSPKGFLLNPAILSFGVGMLLFLLRVKNFLPALLVNAVSVLGSMCTPFSMIILGSRTADVNAKGLVTNVPAWRAVLYKLVAFPLICCAVLWFIPMDPVMRFSIMLLSAAPCASIVSSMAELHHTGQETAANCILLSTLLSVVTVPLLSMLMGLSL